MVWTKKAAKKIVREEKRLTRYKVKYYNREGKRKCYYVRFSEYGEMEDPSTFDKNLKKETDSVIFRKGGKSKKPKSVKIKGPLDILERDRVKKFLNGRKLDYPFLTPFENDLLMRRIVGTSWAKLARKYSGGHDRRSYTATSIKNLLYKIYSKVRLYDRSYRSVPLHISHKKLREKHKYIIKRTGDKFILKPGVKQ